MKLSLEIEKKDDCDNALLLRADQTEPKDVEVLRTFFNLLKSGVEGRVLFLDAGLYGEIRLPLRSMQVYELTNDDKQIR